MISQLTVSQVSTQLYIDQKLVDYSQLTVDCISHNNNRCGSRSDEDILAEASWLNQVVQTVITLNHGLRHDDAWWDIKCYRLIFDQGCLKYTWPIKCNTLYINGHFMNQIMPSNQYWTFFLFTKKLGNNAQFSNLHFTSTPRYYKIHKPQIFGLKFTGLT